MAEGKTKIGSSILLITAKQMSWPNFYQFCETFLLGCISGIILHTHGFILEVLLPYLTLSSTLVLSVIMALLKICHQILGENSQSGLRSYSNKDGVERLENKASMADSGEDSNNCELAEGGCELGMFGDQLCNIPYELYDLPDLKEILSLETWNLCLTEEEMFSLSAYFPDMDQQTFWLTMKELLGGTDMFFGSPLAIFFERLKGGLYPPKVTTFREDLLFLQKRKYYHLLKSYHESMTQTFLDMRKVWNQCGSNIGVEERVYIWQPRNNLKGFDPIDLNEYPTDDDLSTKEVNTKEIVYRLSKKVTHVDGKGVNLHILPPPVVNGLKLLAPSTSGKGVLKIKPPGTNSFQTCIPKSIPNNTWEQCHSTPKGVLKIVPKDASKWQEQLKVVPLWSETNPLIEAQGQQTSSFSPLSTSVYRLVDLGGSPFLTQSVGGKKVNRSPEFPNYIMDRRGLEVLNSNTGSSGNSQNSTRKEKQAKDPLGAIADIRDQNLFLGNPETWRNDERGPKGGHPISTNFQNVRSHGFGSENLWQNFGWENREPSRSSLERYSFSTEYYEEEGRMTPIQEKHISMYPRTSEVVSRVPDIITEEQDMLMTSLDQMKGHRDANVVKLYDQSTVSENCRDGHVLPITYKRRKAQAKHHSVEHVHLQNAGSDFSSRIPKESNRHLGDGGMAVKIKFKNYKDKSLNKQRILNALQSGFPPA